VSETILFDSGQLVLASEDDRLVEGVLLPFGVVGKTNIGGFTVEAGAIALPADPSVVTLNIEHDREQPVGRAVRLEERAEGVFASYQIARTPEGDEALADIKSGRRKSLSMEAKGVIVRAGKAVAGRIFGSGLVEQPAFEGATVIASFNDVPTELTDPDKDGDLDAVVSVTTETVTTETTTVVPVEDEDEDEDEPDAEPDAAEAATVTASEPKEETVAETATAPESVLAKAGGSEKFNAKQAMTVLARAARGDLEDFDLLRKVTRNTEEASVFASQTNIAFPAGDAENLNVPQWLGEFWGIIKPIPLVTDLLTPFDIVSRVQQGFRPTTLPTGGTWAGNGAEIESGPMTFTPAFYTAKAWAGGNTISRENFDFGADAALVESYYTYQGWNFQTWLDAAVISNILAGGQLTHIVADAVPTDPGIDAGTSALVDGVAKYVVTRREAPTFALISETYWKAMMKSPVVAKLAELSQSLGLMEGDLVGIQRRMVPDSYLNDGTNQYHVLVGNKKAGKVGVLPGSPVRAQVVNVANGQIALGAYGYGSYVPQAASDFVGVLPVGATYSAPSAPALSFVYDPSAHLGTTA